MKQAVIWITIALVVGIVFAGLVYNAYVVTPRVKRNLDETLFIPYFDAVDRGHTEEAWRVYTSEAYKRKYTLEEYAALRRESAAKRGKIVRRERTMFNPGKIFSPGTGLWAIYLFDFENKGSREIIYYWISKDAHGFYRIDDSGRRYSAGSKLLHREPW